MWGIVLQKALENDYLLFGMTWCILGVVGYYVLLPIIRVIERYMDIHLTHVSNKNRLDILMQSKLYGIDGGKSDACTQIKRGEGEEDGDPTGGGK